jgi:hypothetical protein
MAPLFAGAFAEAACRAGFSDETAAEIDVGEGFNAEGDSEYGFAVVILNPPGDESECECDDDDESECECDDSTWSDANGAWHIAELNPCDDVNPRSSAPRFDSPAEYLGAAVWRAVCEAEIACIESSIANASESWRGHWTRERDAWIAERDSCDV